MMLHRYLVAFLSLTACDGEETPPLVLPDEFVGETRDLEVYRDPSGDQICPALLQTWQKHVETVGDFFDASGPFGPFTVIITGLGGIASYCEDPNVGGCAPDRPPRAVGSPRAIPHELAHLVDAHEAGGGGLPFWKEGFAEAWSDRGSELPRSAALDDLPANRSRDIYYPAASHLVQWIASAYGRDRVAAFLRTSRREDRLDERVAHFESILGEPYIEVQTRFWREAALYYPGFERCGSTDHVLPANGRIDVGARLDCAVDPGPLNHWSGGRVYTTRVVEVEASGRYGVSAEAGVTLLLPCDPSDDPVDAVRWTAIERDIYTRGPEALSRQIGLRAGRYKLWLIATDKTPRDVRVAVYAVQALTRTAY